MVVVEFNKTIRVRDGCRQGLRTFAFISSCNSFSTCRLTINLSQYMGQRIVVSVLSRPNEIFLVRFFATELTLKRGGHKCLLNMDIIARIFHHFA